MPGKEWCSHAFFDLAKGHLTDVVECRVRNLVRPVVIPTQPRIDHAVLRRWLVHNRNPSPAKLDTFFHRTAWNDWMPRWLKAGESPASKGLRTVF
jgi:hypothetical protein